MWMGENGASSCGRRYFRKRSLDKNIRVFKNIRMRVVDEALEQIFAVAVSFLVLSSMSCELKITLKTTSLPS